MSLRTLLLGSALLVGTVSPAQTDLEQVNEIRRQCADINASHWTERRVAEVADTWVDAYYRNGELRKISARTFSEAGSGVAEYYVHAGELIHVYTQRTSYTQSPADSTTLEAALAPLSETLLVPQKVETRAFFAQRQLIRQYTSGKPLAADDREAFTQSTLERFAELRQAVQKD